MTSRDRIAGVGHAIVPWRLHRWMTERRRRRATAGGASTAAAIRALLALPDEPALCHTAATIAALPPIAKRADAPPEDVAHAQPPVGGSRRARLTRFADAVPHHRPPVRQRLDAADLVAQIAQLRQQVETLELLDRRRTFAGGRWAS